MEQSGLEGVRWIVEDALKFVQREVRRGNRYNGIILDPPAYGRGANGEKWILEDNIGEMLECCRPVVGAARSVSGVEPLFDGVVGNARFDRRATGLRHAV